MYCAWHGMADVNGICKIFFWKCPKCSILVVRGYRSYLATYLMLEMEIPKPNIRLHVEFGYDPIHSFKRR